MLRTVPGIPHGRLVPVSLLESVDGQWRPAGGIRSSDGGASDGLGCAALLLVEDSSLMRVGEARSNPQKQQVRLAAERRITPSRLGATNYPVSSPSDEPRLVARSRTIRIPSGPLRRRANEHEPGKSVPGSVRLVGSPRPRGLSRRFTRCCRPRRRARSTTVRLRRASRVSGAHPIARKRQAHRGT